MSFKRSPPSSPTPLQMSSPSGSSRAWQPISLPSTTLSRQQTHSTTGVYPPTSSTTMTPMSSWRRCSLPYTNFRLRRTHSPSNTMPLTIALHTPMLACASPLLKLYSPFTRRDLLRVASAGVVKPKVELLASRRVMSRVPLPHNGGDLTAHHRRS